MGQLKEELLLQTNQFDSNINSVIRKVEELKNKGGKVGDGFNSSMSKMIEKTTGFNGSLKSLTSIIGKFGGVIGGITAGFSLADWLSNAVTEGTKLAEQGEGIRIAFERLNRGDLLEKLREETHNTVTDLELMKQAVKFNDFKLNIDQMGTLLAFAQQKAKDTGESVDYMVDSIVTGLGRKSLPILDNLGLSAAEIKEEMKKGGDMTTAVAEIIKRKMKESGDYVETAADRAKQKEVELQNALETLGQTFSPLQEASSNFWHSIQIGAIKAINSIAPLINQFTELGRITNAYNSLGGNGKVSKMISFLGDGKGKSKSVYNKQLQEFDKFEEKLKFKISALDGDKSSIAQGNKKRLEEQLSATKKMRAEYIKQANTLFNSKTTNPISEISNTKSTKTKISKSTEINYAVNSVGYLQNKISELQKKIKLQVDSSEIEKLQKEINATKIKLDNLLNPKKVEMKNLGNLLSNPNNNLNKEAANAKLKVEVPIVYKLKFDDIKNGAYDVLNGFQALDDTIQDINSLSDAISNGANAWDIFMASLQTGVGILQTVSTVMESLNNLQMLFGKISLATAEQNAAAGASEMTTAAGVTAAKSGEAIAGATASGAKMPFPLNLIAAVVAALATITGAFANGGVVGGSQYAGDALLARVNSGEMILNGSQQKNLFDLLDKGASGNVSSGNVNFVIRGKDLHGVLSNYDDKMKKVR